MIVNLQNIMSDFYGNYEEPVLSITTLSEDYICPVIEPSAFTSNFKFNDISEINFTVADKIYADGKFIENPSYEELIGMRRIVMEPFGAFVTINPKIQHDGKKTVKEVTAYSFEYTLNYKDMPPLEGTFRFYDPSGTSSDTIMDIVLESAPGWSIGYISPTICSKYRTFSTSTQPVYSFLSNDCQTSFNCIFLYDTMNLKINVYDAADDVETINIFLDSHNLLKGYDIEELSDEIVTCLSVYGADGISIRPVNVLASDKIYNLDYFINKGDIPEDVAAKWNAWSKKCTIYQRLFSDLYSQYYNDQLVANAEEAKLVDLQGELSSMNHVMDTYNTDVSGDHTTEKAELQLQINAKQAEIDAQKTKVDTINTQIQNDQELMKNIVSLCSFKNNFTDDDLAVINAYIREDSLEDSNFALTYVADEPAAIESISEDNKYTVSITSGDLYRADDYVDLTDEEIKSLNLSSEQLNELKNVTDSLNKSYLNHSFFKINSGTITINDTAGKFNLQGGIVNSTLSYSDKANEDGSYDCMIAFSIDAPNWNGDDVTYSNALFVVSGKLTNFTYNADINSINTDNMSFILSSGILTLTCDSSIDMRQHMLQELYDYGQQALSTLAYPAFEFSVDSSNFMSAEEFELFRQQLAIGKKVYLALKDDYYLEPILIGVEIDWMDQKTLKLTFSNKFRSNSPDFLLADTIGQASKTAASLDSNKFNYNAFIDSNIQNDVEKLIKGALDVAKNQIINSNGQNFFADSQGIHLVKLINPATGEYDPAEIRLINNQIVFTNDSWQSADLAIGKITAPDGSSTMGIVAQSLIGEMIIGNKLTIESTGYDSITGQPEVRHFRVDGNGVYLGNSILAMEGNLGNKMLFDPNYGVVLGNSNIYTNNNGNIVVNGLDEEMMPIGSSFYYNINTGKTCFRGDIIATGGSFNVWTDSKDRSIISLGYGDPNAAYSKTEIMPDFIYMGRWENNELTDYTQISSEIIFAPRIDAQEAISINGTNITSLFADRLHNHNDEYADLYHTHSEYAKTNHTHSEYAYSGHLHTQYYESGDNIVANTITLNAPVTASVDPVYRSTTSYRLGTSSSLRKYKNSISEVIDESILPERLYTLPVRQFKWNRDVIGTEYDYEQFSIGFIAEEVDAIYPRATIYRDGELASWSERNLIPPMLSLIQNQKKEIDELRDIVETLQNKLGE